MTQHEDELVRGMAIDQCPQIIRRLSQTELVDLVIPTYIRCGRDSSPYVRSVCFKNIYYFQDSVGPEITKKELLPTVRLLRNEHDPEVQSTEIKNEFN